MRGRVARWFPRGFGWIVPDGGGEDIYTDHRRLMDGLESLAVGQRVSFGIGRAADGRERAVDVHVIDADDDT